MADYLGISDLNADLVGFRPDLGLTTTTEPTLVQAGVQRDQMENRVNAAVSREGLTQPLTSGTNPLGFGIIVQAMKAGVAAYVYRARGYNPDAGDMSQDVVRLEEEWADFFVNLREISGYLIDATTGTGAPETPVYRTVRTGAIDAEYDEATVRKFTREMGY